MSIDCLNRWINLKISIEDFKRSDDGVSKKELKLFKVIFSEPYLVKEIFFY